MFASSSHPRPATRRGVVLILILGMLGLMAMIGVMFASYSGQAEINARNYALAKNAPDPASLLDYALAQLINDTDNPLSAVRGHSLLRDMYGNDAANNGYLAGRPTDGASMMLQTATLVTTGQYAGLYRCRTNILRSDLAFSGYDFTRWMLRFPTNTSVTPTLVGQTFEVVFDDRNAANRTFYLSPPEPSPPNALAPTISGYTSPDTTATQSQLIGLRTNVPFELDGRYLHAFNGPGMGPNALYPNFRVNGSLLGETTTMVGNPNVVGMDEDYDACDLENWFLAIQSADGQVIVPSFHRPGILRADQTDANYPNSLSNDWRNLSADSAARFLRPRNADGHSPISFPDLIPDASGKITFDVDNDGDGITDAVWLDLGYPASRNAAGQLQKPLFAFTVIGLNGRIPLNTAGNLQQRDDAGVPLFDHASHLGNSPSEIDPRYALQNAAAVGYDQVDNALLPDPGIPVSVTQLRNLLAGTRRAGAGNNDTNTVLVGGQPYLFPNGVVDPQDTLTSGVVRNTPAVEGRWGEGGGIPFTLNDSIPNSSNPTLFEVGADYRDNRVRAGLSQGLAGLPNWYGDASDDNSNSFDWYPLRPSRAENSDYFDAAGAPRLPVERIRRFVTPIDLAGDGLVNTFGIANTTGSLTGPDIWGRVSFFRYFRPPGVPLETGWNGAATSPASKTTLITPTVARNATLNPYHAYEAQRNPNIAVATARLFGAMPLSRPGTTTRPTNLPTYDWQTQTQFSLANVPIAGLNEADEMALYEQPGPNEGPSVPRDLVYAPNPNDAPYGPRDLEWLYRKQDIDGSSIESRLEHLAPISFLNPLDGLRRRRMFSTDTWETNRFVWANDNPGNVFPANSQFEAPANYTTINTQTNASFKSLSQQRVAAGGSHLPAPGLAHGGRKINLNYPLPISNDPKEPIRQKWIRDTYEMFKAVLPPLAVDTPEELAQLSQFVVNIIDFRDPDCTITRFVNTDLIVSRANATTAPVLSRRGTTGLVPLPTTPPPPAGVTRGPFSPYYDTTSPYLIQYGMEYSPVAINEVLAYQFYRKDKKTAAGTPEAVATPRVLFELVNSLTEAATTGTSDLDLRGWDVVVMPDDELGRPDPFTGQIRQQTNTATPAPISPVTFGGTLVAPLGRTPPLPAHATSATAAAPANYYYVLENPLPAQSDGKPTETRTPVAPALDNPDTPYDDLTHALTTNGANKYYWLYLRRPLNPMDVDNNYDPARPNENRVVVDSFRFAFNESEGRGFTDPTTGTDTMMDPGTPVPLEEALYSLQRLQPYRGGHAVPHPTTPLTLPAAYGYSDQATPAVVSSAAADQLKGKYGALDATMEIKHTLGTANNPRDDAWEYVPFHDRDFTSVAELLLVPGCPPGLFTKSFVEEVPTYPAPTVTRRISAPASGDPTKGLAPLPPVFTDPSSPAPPKPHTFPYLVDNFFYSGASVTGAGNRVGGPTGAGWFKMLEFLEVPSPVAGAVGTVAQGQNFDWYRQDRKPGLLNLNLIIDEEVFFGLMGNLPLNTTQLTNAQVPRVVTQVNLRGVPNPNGAYSVTNVGYDLNPVNNTNLALMKAAFGDFLKLRHGGSGFLFAFGPIQVPGQPAPAPLPERPFRSLSYPDINYTALRPATLPPSSSNPQSTTLTPPASATTALPPDYVGDPGVKSPHLTAEQPPPIPPRRLFQPPDAYGSLPGFTGVRSNASTRTAAAATFTGDPDINKLTVNTNLRNRYSDLTPTGTATSNPYLGGYAAGSLIDHRQHPYFRTEWLQKVTNLTTVRTHQYAVWITVGFFEVTNPGNPRSPATDPDRLGLEVGAMAGRNVRYRSFFILDRTRAHGFNPSAPGDFREVVTYRQRIQ